MKIFLVTFLLLIEVITSFAQVKVTVRGLLQDSLTSEPLSFATVKVDAKGASSQTKGTIADEKGVFQFVGFKKDKYLIKVEYIGYQSKIIEIGFEKNEPILDLGAINLAPLSQLLESVTVLGLKPNVVTTLEKQVFKSEQFEVAKGGTATDVLKNIPSVIVNAEGEISVRGSKGFLILVNGKPTQLDAATILAQIPANSIDKIEMITAPSAKYDADGKAGIINIVTKSGATDGISITANAQFGLPRIKEYFNDNEPKRHGIDAILNYRKGKWDASFSANYLKNDIAGRRVGNVNTTIGSIFTSFPSEGERSFKRDNYGFRVIVSNKINRSNEISAGWYSGSRTQYRTADIYYFNNTKTDLLTKKQIGQSQYYNPNLVLKEGNFNVYNLDYSHTFNNKSNLSLSGLYEKAVLSGYTKNRNLNFNNFKDTLQYTYNTGNNPLDALRLKADYEKTIGIGKFSMGYQFRNQTQNGSFVYFEKAGNNEPFTINESFTADIAVLNRIHAFYSQYAGVYKKLEFATGLRYENAFREFTDNKDSKPNILKLSNLFPSANLLLDIGSNYKLKAAYSRRVQRSTNNELNPYPEREHSETLEQGDPSIRPEFVGIYELGITKESKKSSIYLNFYSQQIRDIINRVNSVYNDTILNRIFTNAGKAQLIGSEIGITYSPFKKLKIFMGGNIYNLSINGALFDKTVSVNTKGWVYSVNSNINYQFTNSFSSQFNLTYLSARKTAQGDDSRFYQPNLSIKKSFLNNKFTTTVQWQNIAFGQMAVNQQRITTFGKDFYTTTNYIQESNIFLINLSYSFNQTNKKTKLPSSEFGEREF
ncbi:MAG: TonB-dependent receptor [Bacteroidota bacterium]